MLCAIVQVALDPTALGVGRGDEYDLSPMTKLAFKYGVGVTDILTRESGVPSMCNPAKAPKTASRKPSLSNSSLTC